MELLYELKLYFTKLVELDLLEKMPTLTEIEEYADICYDKGVKVLEDFLSPVLSSEHYEALSGHIGKILQICADEKKAK
jgi:hypothetical protein